MTVSVSSLHQGAWSRMPKEIASFIYGQDEIPEWAFGKVTTVPGSETMRCVQKLVNGKKIGAWIPYPKLPMFEGAPIIRTGDKTTLFSDGHIEVKRCLTYSCHLKSS